MPTILINGSDLLISNPLDYVYKLFDQANQPIQDDGNDWGVSAFFARILKDPVELEKVPVLNSQTIDSIPNGSLCRYQGMVQDMLDPEYYVGAFRPPQGLWQTRKYSDDCSEIIASDVETAIWARKPLYCCSVPGQSEWATLQARHAPRTSTRAVPSQKRERDDTVEAVAMETDGPGSRKALRVEDPSATGAALASSLTTNAPSNDRAQEGDCIVFTYDKEEALRLNDVVEILGIKSTVPELASLHMSPQEGDAKTDFMEEDMAAKPPTSLVPRIHALAAAKVTRVDALPIIAFKGAEERQAQVAELRTVALKYLQSILFGDDIAAEYVLLQLISRTYSRSESAALGLVSLNLTNCPIESGKPNAAAPLGSPEALSEFAKAFQRGLSSLAQSCVALPISVNQLNKQSWRPARDLTTNRLHKTPLQLPEGSQLILDETLLAAGQLTALGVRNFETLKSLLETQKVDYDFSFYTLPVNTDVAVTILSEKKSLLHASLDVTVPLLGRQSSDTTGSGGVPHEGELSSVRAYLALVRSMEFTIDAEMSNFLENELVEARKQDKDLDPSAMHSWLTIARLLALSHGFDRLTTEHWRGMQHLEFKRAQRIRASG